MLKKISYLVGSFALIFSFSAEASYYYYCAAGEHSWTCEAAARGQSGYRAVGCVGTVGEGPIPYPTESNIYRTYLTYGYQQRPRRPYNRVNGPTFYFRADSYDWACGYTAIQVGY